MEKLNYKDWILITIYVVMMAVAVLFGMSGAEHISIWRMLIAVTIATTIHFIYSYLGILRYIGNKLQD